VTRPHALGVARVVVKTRRRLRLGATRLHLDEVEGLGSFIELETVIDGQSDAEAHAELRSIASALGIEEHALAAVPTPTCSVSTRRRPGSQEADPPSTRRSPHQDSKDRERSTVPGCGPASGHGASSEQIRILHLFSSLKSRSQCRSASRWIGHFGKARHCRARALLVSEHRPFWSSKMPMDPRSAAIMTRSQPPVHAELLEAGWYSGSSEEDSRTEQEVNHSAPIETYDSTPGVCNELARIAMNRSAVMQVYDSMFPRSGVSRATTRRSSPPREPALPGWLRRTLDTLRGRRPR